MSHLLIYDADLSGHHRDYLNAVVAYVEIHSPLLNGISQVSFMLPTRYWSDLDKQGSLTYANRIDISSTALAHRNSLSPRKRALFEIELLVDAVEKHKVDELMLMNLDYFQVALASSLARQLTCDVSGIQLQPYTRSELVARQPPYSLALWFRALRKRFRLQQILRNISIARLCIPADSAAVDMLNQRHGSQLLVAMMPEPYLGNGVDEHAPDANESPDILVRYSIPSGSRIILIFGSINVRKNVENVIIAMKLLYQSGRKDIVLLVVGKANAGYQKKLRNLVDNDQDAQSYIRLDFEFVDDAVMQALFRVSDVVAMPYFKTYQSSGVLFTAVQHKKPVITANRGLVGDLVWQYDLGESVDPSCPRQIADAIVTLLDKWEPSSGVQALVDFHTAKNHAAVVLNQGLASIES